MADDTTKGGPGDFDDWLDDQPGPPTDPTNPYKDLASGDADEIADWMAFTEGSPGKMPEPEPVDHTGEIEVVATSGDESGGDAEADEPGVFDDQDLQNAETVEIDAVDLDAAGAADAGETDGADMVVFDVDAAEPAAAQADAVAVDDAVDVDPAGVADAGETDGVDADAVDMAASEPAIAEPDAVEVDDAVDADASEPEVVEPKAVEVDAAEADAVEPDAEVSASTASDGDHPPELPSVMAEDPDDTGEIEVVPIAPFGGFTQETEPLPPESRELFDLSSSEYVATATTEHTDLAEAIAAASTQDTEQVPIAAPIPGMTDTIVGFEDVVAAEGIGRARARAPGDLVARVVTAVILVLALGASMVWRPALAIFVLAIFVLGAGEFYTSLVRADHKPISLFGFVGIIGASAGAYFWGSIAIPIAFIVAVAMLLLYYAVVPGRADPLGNLALTITVMVWVGLGSYAMLIVVSDSYRPLVISVVVIVAAMDIGQYFIGRAIGRTPLSPWVSPKKTVEGLVAGIFIALVFGALLHFVEPFELTSGLALGTAVAILAPIGDLAMSAAKRALGLKDMGSVLPGHGGFLDRIDGLLFVIPAAWLVFLWAGIL